MYCLGLTGMIASGKSTVAKLLQELGAFVISADQISRDITQNNKSVITKIINKFGEKVKTDSNKLNRHELRNIIFNDHNAKQWLEDLLHPLIRNEITRQIKNSKSKINVVEIPLLKDRTPFPYLDKVLLITTDTETQLSRIMQRDNCTIEQAKQIILSQPSLTTYKSIADIVLQNNGSSEKLKENVTQIFNNIQASIAD